MLTKTCQRWISANPGLNVNLLFWFGYIFCTSVYFKTLKIKLVLNQTIILETIFMHVYKQAVGKVALKFPFSGPKLVHCKKPKNIKA
jgi:hypothetical protein